MTTMTGEFLLGVPGSGSDWTRCNARERELVARPTGRTALGCLDLRHVRRRTATRSPRFPLAATWSGSRCPASSAPRARWS